MIAFLKALLRILYSPNWSFIAILSGTSALLFAGIAAILKKLGLLTSWPWKLIWIPAVVGAIILLAFLIFIVIDLSKKRIPF